MAIRTGMYVLAAAEICGLLFFLDGGRILPPGVFLLAAILLMAASLIILMRGAVGVAKLRAANARPGPPGATNTLVVQTSLGVAILAIGMTFLIFLLSSLPQFPAISLLVRELLFGGGDPWQEWLIYLILSPLPLLITASLLLVSCFVRIPLADLLLLD